MTTELTADQKGQASLTLHEVVESTCNNFPDPRYRPIVSGRSEYYTFTGLDVSPHKIATNSDGIGTKPNLAERLAEETGNADYFETLPFDAIAMVEADGLRFGYFPIGMNNIIDVNRADPVMIAALARGLKKAADEGQYAILNGETAELGYRTSGYGKRRVNINATGIMLVVDSKRITGEHIEAGQPIVGIREKSVRSNGYTKNTDILDRSFLKQLGYASKKEYVLENLGDFLQDEHVISAKRGREKFTKSADIILEFLNDHMGHDFLEQVLLPWHEPGLGYTDAIEALISPSTLYARLMYTAQGGIDGPREVDITGIAHISGGGVPEKVKRLLEPKRLGADIKSVFPDPLGVRYLFELAEDLPLKEDDSPVLTHREACQQWNRGIGLAIIVKTQSDANRLIDLAGELGYEGAEVGKILLNPTIHWRGEVWTY